MLTMLYEKDRRNTDRTNTLDERNQSGNKKGEKKKHKATMVFHFTERSVRQ